MVAAFLLSGFWNAGTPFDTASTPDSATAPEENARSSISRLRLFALSANSTASALTDAGSISLMFLRMKMRTRPTMMSVINDNT